MKINYIFLFLTFTILNTTVVSLKKTRLNLNKKCVYSVKYDQCIITTKNNNTYCNSEAELYIKQNDFLTNKKLITISPGGFKGFYYLGILTYIKKNYNIDNFIFSGASAGAWNSLFMCYKGEPLDFVYNLLDYNIKKAKSISELQYFLKYKLLSTYKSDDFDLHRLFIGVTSFNKFKPKTNIFSEFNDLEDAINCCMASSHIPFITGGITNRYHDMFSFDGGFSSYPYLQKENCVLHVSPRIWEEPNKKRNIKTLFESIRHYSEFFSISHNNFLELYDIGYNEAKLNKQYLDKLFIERKEESNIEF
jgi:hypothetical protein